MKGSLVIGFALAGAVALTAAPASAQHRRDGGEERHQSEAAPRAERQPAPPARQQQQPQPQPQPRAEQRQEPQRQQEQRAVPRTDQRSTPPREAPPRYAAPRYEAPRYAAPRYSAPQYTGRYVGPRYSGPRFSYSPRRFYRPYYVFRPRFSIGFGIWAGYPVTYYDPYYYPYDYAPYPPSGGVYVTPNQSNMGGISFDISPNNAEIWVDGNFMGVVSDYTPSSQPLGLSGGRHHIELREPGFEVSSFDVDVIPGQVIPFQGQLEQ